MMTKEVEAIDPALVARMVAFVRTVAEKDGAGFIQAAKSDARDIVALLPKPVDPDLLEAREIAQQSRIARNSYGFQQGQSDTHPLVVCALAAIKRGRELAPARGDDGRFAKREAVSNNDQQPATLANSPIMREIRNG